MSIRYQISFLMIYALMAMTPAWAQEAETYIADESVRIAEVNLDGEILFRLRGISSHPASLRAAQTRERIIEVAKNHSISPDSGTIEPRDGRVAVVFRGQDVVTFFPGDAAIEGVPLPLLAEVALGRLATAIADYRENRSPAQLIRKTGILLGITVAAALLLWAVTALFGWLNRVVERRVKRQIKQLEEVSHRVLDARQIWGWLGGLLRGSRFLILFLIVLLWLEAALGLYPWTRSLAAQLFVLVLDPLKTMGNGLLLSLPDLIFLAVLFVVLRFLLRAVRTFFERVHRGWIRPQNFDRELAMPTYRIVRVATIVFGLVIAYPYIPGSDSDAFKGMSIFFGVILSLGSSSFIANIIAGYSLTYRRAFREGDRIKVGDLEGTVLEMTTLNTRIRSLKNEEINIPNSLVLGSAIVNYNTFQRDPGLILHTEVGIGYDVSWRQVEAMLLEAARRTNGLKQEPPPFVLQRSLGDFTVLYQLNAYCDRAELMNSEYSLLHGNIQDVFNEYGVQIMSPNYVADPDRAKVVSPDQWYPPPAQPPAT